MRLRNVALGSAMACVMLSAAAISARSDGDLSAALAKIPAPPEYIYKGRTEYSLRGDLRLNSPSSQRISLRVAPMITDNIQAGIDFSYLHNSGDTGFIGAIGNYYLGHPENATRFYAGIGAGTNFGDNSQGEYGVQGGVKHFVSPNVAIGGELQYRRMGGMDWSGFLLDVSYFGGRGLVDPEFELPHKHTIEYNVSSRLDFDQDSDCFDLCVEPYICPHVQLGGNFSIRHADGDTGGFIGAIADYNFMPNNKSRLVPFIGARVGNYLGRLAECLLVRSARGNQVFPEHGRCGDGAL